MGKFLPALITISIGFSQCSFAAQDRRRDAGLGLERQGLSQFEREKLGRIGQENGELSSDNEKLRREKDIAEREAAVFRKLKEEFSQQMTAWSAEDQQPRGTIGMSNKRRSEKPEDLNQPAEALNLTEWVTVLEGVSSGVTRSIAVATKKETLAEGAPFEIDLDPRSPAESLALTDGKFKLALPKGNDATVVRDQRKKTADMLSADLTFTSSEALAGLIFPEPGQEPKAPSQPPSAPLVPSAGEHPGEAEATPVPVEEPIAAKKIEYVPIATEVNEFLKQQMLAAKQAADAFQTERDQAGNPSLADSGSGAGGAPSESPSPDKGGGGGGGGGAPGGGEGGGGGNGGPPLGGVAAPGLATAAFGNLAMDPVQGVGQRLPIPSGGIATPDFHPGKNTIPELFKTAARKLGDGATKLADNVKETVKDWMKSAAGSGSGTGAGAAPPEALNSDPTSGATMGAPRGGADGGGDIGAGIGPTFEGGGGAPSSVEVAYGSGGSSVDGGTDIGMKNANKEGDLPSQIASLKTVSREISSVGSATKKGEAAIFQLARDKFKGLKLERRPGRLLEEDAV